MHECCLRRPRRSVYLPFYRCAVSTTQQGAKRLLAEGMINHTVQGVSSAMHVLRMFIKSTWAELR